MNLLFEMLLLTLGVSLLVGVFYKIIVNIPIVLETLKKDRFMTINVGPLVIITIIGIMLIIISQKL